MKRREFIKASIATSTAAVAAANSLEVRADEEKEESPSCCDRTYATPAAAMNAPPEKIAYVPAIYAGTETKKPDYLATIDIDPESPTYSKVIARLPMPNVGDELHHFGWNSCSSCHGEEGKSRRFIVLPGIGSGRIHIVDTEDERNPKIHKIIEAKEIADKTDLSAPHTVHCLADGNIMISMLGDAKGEGPGGFMLLDDGFNVKGRWEKDMTGMKFNYDYWYQPRHNVMISSEWGAPNTVSKGFNPAEVAAGKYGRQIHFWDWTEPVSYTHLTLPTKA